MLDQCPSGGNLTNCGINCLGLVIARTAGMGRHENFCRINFTLLLLTSVAFPQQGREPGENANTWVDKQDAGAARAALQREKQKELDAQYKAALGRAKVPVAPSDPWADVRSVKTPASGR